MRSDRTVQFGPNDPIAGRDRIRRILNGFFGSKPCRVRETLTGHICEWEILIPGEPSRERDWFRVDPREPTPDFETTTRWIEVWFDDSRRLDDVAVATITVTTRSQDSFTMALADGLLRAIARNTKGRILNHDD